MHNHKKHSLLLFSERSVFFILFRLSFASSLRPAVWQRIKLRVKGIEVFAVQLLLSNAQHFTEALEVDDFPLPQEFDDIPHVRIVCQAQNVVIRCSRFLVCAYMITYKSILGITISSKLSGDIVRFPFCVLL